MLSETFVLLAQMCVRCVPSIYWYRMCMLVLLACICRNQCRLPISYHIAVWLQRKHVEINESPQKYAEEDHNKKDFTSVALLCGPQWHRDLNIRRRHQYKSVHLFLQELFSLIWSASHANHDIKEHKQLFFYSMVLALPFFLHFIRFFFHVCCLRYFVWFPFFSITVVVRWCSYVTHFTNYY